ncbi:hypothetical protein MYSE111917_18150 [Mycobacterium senriense]
MLFGVRIGEFRCRHDGGLIPGEPRRRRHRGGIPERRRHRGGIPSRRGHGGLVAGQPDRRRHGRRAPGPQHRRRRGGDRGAAGERKGGILGDPHPHGRRVAELVGHPVQIGRGPEQIHILRGVGVGAQVRHHGVERRRRIAARSTRQRLAGQHGRRRVGITVRTHHRQRRGRVVHHQRRAGPAGRAHQGGHRLRFGEHRDVVHARVLQRPPQLVGGGMVGPAQPGADQPVVLAGQQPVRADHRLGQRPDRIVSEVDDGLVDHVGPLRTRPDQGQARDGSGDRNPQNDVHPGSPHAGHPATSNVPASLHLRYRWHYQSFRRQASPTSAA